MLMYVDYVHVCVYMRACVSLQVCSYNKCVPTTNVSSSVYLRGMTWMVHCSSRRLSVRASGMLTSVLLAFSQPCWQSGKSNTSIHMGILLHQSRFICFCLASARLHCNTHETLQHTWDTATHMRHCNTHETLQHTWHTHDTLQHMTHCNTHDTLQHTWHTHETLQHTWYTATHDTLQHTWHTHDTHMTHCNTWHTATHMTHTWDTATHMRHCNTWHTATHMTVMTHTWHMTHCNTWYIAIHDTLQHTWHTATPDTLQYMTHCNTHYILQHTWHSAKHDTLQHIATHIACSTQDCNTHDTLQHTSHPATHDTTTHMTHCNIHNTEQYSSPLSPVRFKPSLSWEVTTSVTLLEYHWPNLHTLWNTNLLHPEQYTPNLCHGATNDTISAQPYAMSQCPLENFIRQSVGLKNYITFSYCCDRISFTNYVSFKVVEIYIFLHSTRTSTRVFFVMHPAPGVRNHQFDVTAHCRVQEKNSVNV